MRKMLEECRIAAKSFLSDSSTETGNNLYLPYRQQIRDQINYESEG